MSGREWVWVAVVFLAYMVGFSDGAFAVAEEVDKQGSVLGFAR